MLAMIRTQGRKSLNVNILKNRPKLVLFDGDRLRRLHFSYRRKSCRRRGQEIFQFSEPRAREIKKRRHRD